MSYSILDESMLSLVPEVLGYYIRFGVTAVAPVFMGLVGLAVLLIVIHNFL